MQISPQDTKTRLYSILRLISFTNLLLVFSYLSTCSCPDIAFSIVSFARSLHDPSQWHLNMAKRICRYIAGTLNYGLQFPSRQIITQLSLRVSVDADWGGCKDSKRSISGFIFDINGTPILSRSKRRPLVALSSGEAWYISLCTFLKEVT